MDRFHRPGSRSFLSFFSKTQLKYGLTVVVVVAGRASEILKPSSGKGLLRSTTELHLSQPLRGPGQVSSSYFAACLPLASCLEESPRAIPPTRSSPLPLGYE
jgi:hypothetical protein